MKKSNFKPQYISRKSYLANSTLVINPSKTKPKLSRTPKLLSSFVIASGLIGLMFFSLNVEAKPIRYECTDTNVVGLGGLMDGNVQGYEFENETFVIEVDTESETIHTISGIGQGWDSGVEDQIFNAQCETVGDNDQQIYSVCSDHYGQIILNYYSGYFTRTYHSGNIPFTDSIFVGLGVCEQMFEISPEKIVG